MITFKIFLSEEITNNIGSGNIATKDGVLGGIIRKKDFMGCKVFQTDHTTYSKCIMNGKPKGEHWLKYFSNKESHNILKKEFYKQKPLMLQSELTKQLIYLRK